MAKSEPKPKANRDSSKHVSREYVHSLRGKFKGKGLLKALMAEKEKEKEILKDRHEPTKVHSSSP